MDACEVTFLLNEGDGKITELQEGVWKGAERTLQKWSRSHDAGAVYHVFSCVFFFSPRALGFYRLGGSDIFSLGIVGTSLKQLNKCKTSF